MSPVVYLVSGANKGIGFGLVQKLASLPDTLVWAGARNPDKADALNALAKANPSAVKVIKLISTDVENNAAAVSIIEKESGKLDVVIANAGVSGKAQPMIMADLAEFRATFETNALGPLALFQATYPLLKKAGTRKFFIISSAAGSISTQVPIPFGAYSTSKAAVNYISQKLGTELGGEGFTVIPFEPGFVSTDMNASVLAQLPPEVPAMLAAKGITAISATQSAEGMVKLMLAATPADNGKFYHTNGEIVLW